MTIPQTLTSLFTPCECEVHSWCVRMGLVVLGIGGVLVVVWWPL